jgi:hypothetical protein
MSKRIETFEALITFIEGHDLNLNDLNVILLQSIGGIIIEDYNKEETIQVLKIHWTKYKDFQEKPLFIIDH